MRICIAILFLFAFQSEAFAAPESWSIDISLFGLMFNHFMATYIDYLGAIYSDLLTFFRTPMRILLTFYIVYVGCRLMVEGYRELRGAMFTCIYISLVYASLFEWSNYANYVVLPIFNLGLDLSAFFINASDGTSIKTVQDIFLVLDKVAHQFFGAIQMFVPNGSAVWNAGAYIIYILAAIPLFILFFVLTLTFFYLFTMSFTGMFVFFIIGGPILMLAALKKTHGILIAWVKGVLNYFLQAIFVAAGMGIHLMGLMEVANLLESQAEAGASLLSPLYLKAIVWLLFSIAVLLKAPNLAAHMSSSAGGGSSSVLGATMTTASIVMSGALYGNYKANDLIPGHKTGKKEFSGAEATRMLNKERNIRGGDR